MAPRHRLGEEVAGHLPRRARGDLSGKEEPRVRALPGPRAFDRHRHAEISARLGEGSRIVGPAALVEVSREEPARVVDKKEVDSHDTLAVQMVEDCLFRDWEESLVGAFAALDTGLLADATHPLVRADGGVPMSAGLGVGPELCVYIVPTPEQTPEQRHSFC